MHCFDFSYSKPQTTPSKQCGANKTSSRTPEIQSSGEAARNQLGTSVLNGTALAPYLCPSLVSVVHSTSSPYPASSPTFPRPMAPNRPAGLHCSCLRQHGSFRLPRLPPKPLPSLTIGRQDLSRGPSAHVVSYSLYNVCVWLVQHLR